MNIQSIIDTIKNNQLLLAGIGLSGAGIISFWLKDVPRTLYHFLRRELTTELIVTSQNLIFHEMLKWIEKNYKDTNFRRLKLSNGMWGNNENTTTSIGYGIHWIRFKNNIFLFNLVKESSNQSERDKETITITKLGRGRKSFDEFVNEVKKVNMDVNSTKIYKMDGCWSYIKDQKKRNLDSVFIEKDKKDFLINNLTKFIDNEEWYIENGIPYQLGILLYGPPGTGKTSLIKAISGYLNYPIYYISPQQLDKIEYAMSTLPDKCVVVIEDIDSNFVTHARRSRNDDNVITVEDKPRSIEQSFIDDISAISLSEILNSLDGMFSAHGRILLATTNHIENLDAALIRPGRIDFKIEIGYVNNEIFENFLRKFFPEKDIDYDKIKNMKIKSELTVAILQNMLLKGDDENQIIDYVQAK